MLLLLDDKNHDAKRAWRSRFRIGHPGRSHPTFGPSRRRLVPSIIIIICFVEYYFACVLLFLSTLKQPSAGTTLHISQYHT
jgi:hypothetical protein